MNKMSMEGSLASHFGINCIIMKIETIIIKIMDKLLNNILYENWKLDFTSSIFSRSKTIERIAIKAKAANPFGPNKLIERIVPNPINISNKKAIFKFLYFKYYLCPKI